MSCSIEHDYALVCDLYERHLMPSLAHALVAMAQAKG
jgi:hypothetical protein